MGTGLTLLPVTNFLETDAQQAATTLGLQLVIRPGYIALRDVYRLEGELGGGPIWAETTQGGSARDEPITEVNAPFSPCLLYTSDAADE